MWRSDFSNNSTNTNTESLKCMNFILLTQSALVATQRTGLFSGHSIYLRWISVICTVQFENPLLSWAVTFYYTDNYCNQWHIKNTSVRERFQMHFSCTSKFYLLKSILIKALVVDWYWFFYGWWHKVGWKMADKLKMSKKTFVVTEM